jgi:hypothetical protein
MLQATIPSYEPSNNDDEEEEKEKDLPPGISDFVKLPAKKKPKFKNKQEIGLDDLGKLFE